MANIQSQKKRNRQSEKRRDKNAQVRSSVRTIAKKVIKAIEAPEKDAAMINDLYNNYVKTIDTVSRKGIENQKRAARKKSRMAKKVNAALAQTK